MAIGKAPGVLEHVATNNAVDPMQAVFLLGGLDLPPEVLLRRQGSLQVQAEADNHAGTLPSSVALQLPLQAAGSGE